MRNEQELYCRRYIVDYVVDYQTGEARIIIRDTLRNACIDSESLHFSMMGPDEHHEFHAICLELNATYEDDQLYLKEIEMYANRN